MPKTENLCFTYSLNFPTNPTTASQVQLF